MLSTLALFSTMNAHAGALDADRFTLLLPAQVNVVGLSAGVMPGMLWRPLGPDSRAHVRAAVGIVAGPELAVVPVAVGVRGVLRPDKTFRPGFGAGLQFQAFMPYGHELVPRLDQYYEFTLDYEVRDGLRVAAELSPEFGWIGGFGLGMVGRLGVQMDFPVAR